MALSLQLLCDLEGNSNGALSVFARQSNHVSMCMQSCRDSVVCATASALVISVGGVGACYLRRRQRQRQGEVFGPGPGGWYYNWRPKPTQSPRCPSAFFADSQKNNKKNQHSSPNSLDPDQNPSRRGQRCDEVEARGEHHRRRCRTFPAPAMRGGPRVCVLARAFPKLRIRSYKSAAIIWCFMILALPPTSFYNLEANVFKINLL